MEYIVKCWAIMVLDFFIMAYNKSISSKLWITIKLCEL